MFDNMNLGNLGELINTVQQKAEEVKQESASKIYEAKSGGGLIVVRGKGDGEIFDIDIDDSLLEDKDSLQILLISAIIASTLSITSTFDNCTFLLLITIGFDFNIIFP